MTIDYKVLGNRIKVQRMIKGTTQEHFAEHLDVSVGYVSQIERGITKISLDRLAEISDYLECSMGLLLEGTDVGDDSTYLRSDINNMYGRLSAYEKWMVSLLLKHYIDNR